MRRALRAHLATGDPGPSTTLRAFALAHTLYRPAGVPRALHSLLARGALARDPERGRLTGATLVRRAG